LRSDALPLSDEQIRTDRESHPKYGEWKSKSADLLWRSRMLAIEAWPDRVAVEAELAAESAAKQLPSDADGLNALAWKLVDPKQPVLGEEVRALLLAKRALDMAAADKRAGIRDTYAWALYRTGKLEEALDEMKTAVSEPGGDELKQSGKDLEKAVQQWQGDEVAKRRERRESLSKEVDALAAAVSERRTFEYADAEKSWWDRQLRVLVANLELLQDEKTGLAGVGITSEQGWGVGRRYELAKSLRERTIVGPEAKRRWEGAILAIAKSEKYRDTVFPGGGLLTPQEGLLPLGADPQSGLWEFWHVQSGDEPERDKEGKFVRQKSGAHKLVERSDRGTGTANQGTGTADQGTGIADQGTGVFGSGTGIVLVLIPGGTFWMGAQKTDPNGQNFDREARSDESVHRVTLSPYFLSKYELTQGQWQRFTGSNPSSYKSGHTTIGPTNPVERVSWLDCERVLRRLGLELPSEAQWEFGARGGTSSVWWTGSEKESLTDKVNLADQSFVAFGGPATQAAWWPEFNDGFPVHAPVGRLGANDFGLHEVCGNVFEWCFDAYESYPEAGDASSAARDPLVDGDGLAARVARGGCFFIAAAFARSAYRYNHTPAAQDSALGVRPSRALRLSTSPPHNAR
jgi:formylglycine-generating enzyme required for sulfatase activity/tetratricopeptide (TPR) repeat protein